MIRGPLPKLGLSGLCTKRNYTWAATGVLLLGGATWGLDRHELAHAAIDQFRYPGADPPCVLDKGVTICRCKVPTGDWVARDTLTHHIQRAHRSDCVNSWDHSSTAGIVDPVY